MPRVLALAALVGASGCAGPPTARVLASGEAADVSRASADGDGELLEPSALSSARKPTWCFGGGATFAGPPAITDEGAIYVTTHEGHLHALAADGGYRYSYTLEGHITGGPAWWRDRVYVPTARGRVYALTDVGSLLWVARVPLAPLTGLAVDAHGTGYFVAADGRLYALSPWGTLKYSLTVPELPVVALENVGDRRVLVQTAAGRLFVLGAGRVESLGAPSAFAVSAEGAIRGIVDGTFVALGGPGASVQAKVGPGAAMSAAEGGWVVVNEAGDVVWLDGEGCQTARRSTGLAGLRSVTSERGIAYVADDDRGLFALDPSGGQKTAFERPSGPVQALVADPLRRQVLLMTTDRLCGYPTGDAP